MNTDPRSRTPVWIYAIGVGGTFLIMALLVGIMYRFTRPPDLRTTRGEERRKNLVELNSTTREQIENYAWLDESKGIVRLPVAKDMQLTLDQWPDPAAARSNLLERLAKATFKPPEAPNPFE